MILYVRIFICILVSSLIFTGTTQAQTQTVGVTSVTPNPVCAGSTIVASYTYSAADPGTLFLYLNGPGTTDVLLNVAASTGGNGSITAPIPTDRTTGTYTVRIIRISGTTGTINSPNSSGFTINALPAAPGVTNISYCVGATNAQPLTATGQNLKWYTNSSGGAGTSIAPTPPTSTTGTTNYYVSQTDGNGCESPRATLPVTINPLPAKPTVVSSLSYCQNATAPSLAAAVTSGSNLKWYTSASSGVGSTIAPIPSTSGVGAITYYVSQTDGNGCESDRADITVTTKAIPNPPSVTTPVIYCQNAVASPLSATPGGGTLNWYDPSNNPLGSTAPTPPTSAPGTTFYSVSQTISGCESTKATITVTINTRPNAPTTTPVGVCQNTTPVSLATGVTATGTLKWYTGSSGGAGSTVAPTPPTTSVGSTPYYVTQTDGNGCESDRAVLTFNVYAYPTAPTVNPSSLTYCQGSTTAVPLTATSAPGATLNYYDVPTNGTPYGSLTPLTTSSNNYYVSQTLNGCESPRATITIIVKAIPPKPLATTPVTYCQFGVAAPLSATASTTNNTIYWYGTDAIGGSASTAAPTPPTNTATTLNYFVSERDPIGCESDRTQISVTIYAKPVAPTTTPASACLNSVPNPLALSVTGTSGTLKWYTVPAGGTGSTVAPTLSTTATGPTTYYVSQTSGDGCESDLTAITFTVNPLPAAPTTSAVPVFNCQNSVASPLTATGTNLKWYLTNIGGSALPNPVIPSTSVANTVTYYVTQTDGNGCESPRSTLIVTTGSLPVAPTVSSTPVTYCQYVTPVSLTATAISGNTLLWYGTDATAGTPSTVATVPSTGTPGSVPYYVSQRDGNGCESSTRSSITVTVNAKPAAPTTTSITLCQNATPVSLATAVTAGTNLKWYTSSSGGTGSMVAFPLSTTATGSTTYYVSQTSGDGCESDRIAVIVIVKPLPSAPTVTPSSQNICQSSMPGALTAIASPGGTLNWYDNAGNPYSSITPNTSTVEPIQYSVSQTVDGCEGQKAPLTVVIIAKPSVPTVTGTINVCQASAPETLTATGTNLKWYTDPTVGTPSTTAPTPPRSSSGTTTYYVTQTDGNGCESDRAPITITIKPKPSPPGTAPISFCSNQATTLTATFDTGTTQNWYGTNPSSTPTSTASTPSTAVIGYAIPYYVSQTLSGCESSTASIAVTIKALPVAPTVNSTPIYYCQDAASVPLSATAASGGSLNWYGTNVSGGTALSTPPTPPTTISSTPTTLYYVSQTVDGCEGPRASIAVTINPRPIKPTVVSSLSYCQNTTAAILSATAAGTLNWFDASGTAIPTPTPTTTTSGTTTYYVSQTDLNGCESDRASITVTVFATPALPTTAAVSVCQNATPVAISAMASSGGTLNWYTAGTGGTPSSSAPVPPTSATGTTTYYVSQSINGCEGPRASLDVTIKPLPTAPTVSTNVVSYCQNSTPTALTATASAGGTLLWYIGQPGGGSTPNGPVAPTPSTSSVGSALYYVSQVVDGCEGPQTTITVTINPLPTAPAVNSNTIPLCQNAPPVALTATASAGGTLLWYTDLAVASSLVAPTLSTTSPATTIYYVSQRVNGCEGPKTAIAVIVTATPTAPTTSSVSLCQNAQATALTATPASGGTLNWYGTNATGGTSGAAPVPSTSTVNPTTYYVSQSVNGCEGPRASLDVTIKPRPSAPTLSTSAVSYCQTETATALLATPSPGGTVLWYVSQTGGTQAPLGPVAPTPSTTTPDIFTYFASQSVNGCEGPQSSITVTIKALPFAPSVSVSTLAYCQNSIAPALIATPSAGGTLNWYTVATGGTPNSATPTPPTSTVGSTVYYVSQIVNGCEGPRNSITVTITATPAAPTTSAVSFCLNEVVTALTAIPASGGTLNWYTNPTGGTSSPSLIPSTSTAGSPIYYVSQSVNGCEGPRAGLTVTIKSPPSAPSLITSSVSFCQNAQATALTAIPASGGTLNWYTTPTGGTPSSSLIPPTSTVGSIIYYVSQIVNGCEGPRASITVTIKPLPTAPSVGTGTVNFCQGTIATPLTATPAGGGTLSWYTTQTGGTASSIAPTPVTTTPGLTSYYVSQTVNGCEGPLAQIAVLIQTTPPAPAVGSAPLYCQGGATTALSAVATSGGSLNWYTTPTGGTASPTPPVPPVATAGSIIYYVSQSLNGCEGPRVSLTATIKAAPSVPAITTNPTYCQGATATTLTATPNGGVLNWYTASIGGSASSVAPVPATSSPGTTVYYVSQTDANGCESNRTPLTVKVNPLPVAPSVLPATYCQGTIATALVATPASGGTLNWYSTQAGGTPTPIPPTPVTTQSGVIPYYVSQTDINSCESSRSLLLVTITATPAAPVVPTIAPVCQNSPSFAVQAAGQSQKWYADATSTASLGGSVTQSTALAGTFIYYVSQTINSCESLRAPVQIVVNALPAAPLVVNQNGCQDAVVQVLTATGTALQWYDGNDNLIAPPTPITKVDVTQAYTYKVTQTLNSCTSPKAILTYTVNVTPLPTVIPLIAYCQSAIAKPLTATGTNLKWTDPTGVVSANAPTPSTLAITAGASYSVTQTSTLGCESRKAEIKVAVNALPVAKLDGTASVYLGSPALLTLTLTGAGPYSYTLSDGTSGVAETSTTSETTIKRVSVIPGATTTYSIVGVTNACGNGPISGSAVVTVKVPTLTTSPLSMSTVCIGTSFTVPFSTTGEFVSGNAFTVEIATTAGDSASRKYIPVSNGIIQGPFVAATIPGTVAPGQYYVRVVASNAPFPILGTRSPTVINVRPLPTVSLSASKTSIYKGQSAELLFTFTGEGPWTTTFSSGTDITAIGTATNVYSATVTPAITTTYKLLTVSNSCGSGTKTGVDTVTIHVEILTAEADPFTSSVKVYPVPTDGDVTVDIDLPLQSEPAQLRLVGPNGHITEQVTTKKRQTILHLDKEPAGIYLLQITIGNQSAVRKILKW